MSNVRANRPLGNIEAAIAGHYDQLNAGAVNGFGARIDAPVETVPAPVESNAVKPFIHLDYTVNENGHRDFELSSAGIATDIEGIVAELEHTLSHLRSEVAAQKEAKKETPAAE